MNRPSGSAAPAAGRVLAALPTLLAMVAEGAWVAVLYALLRGAAQEEIQLGPLVFAVFAGLGLLVGRVLAPRLGDRWPAGAVVAAGLATAAGWLSDAATWSALLSTEPLSALGTNPGGWLTGLAFLRGLAYVRPPDPGGAVRSPLPIALPLIAVAFLIGGMIAEPGRSAFRDAALVSTVVFVASATLAVALGRAGTLGRAGGFDWRSNPAWYGLLVVVVAGILLVAVPAAHAVGPLVIVVIAALPVPLFFVGLVVGFDRRLLKVLLVLLGIVAILVVIFQLFSSGPVLPETGPAGQVPAQPATPDWLVIAGGVILLVLVAVAVGVLAALWMRQAPQREDGDVEEERTVDRGLAGRSSPPRRVRFGLRRREEPTDAPTAYLATLGELASDPALERHADETPAEHARRLRGSDPGLRFGAAVNLLAADYELARFGASALTPAEHRRALARWRRVRALVRRPGSP
jgi:Domain of unknown function (DUF4129)